MKRLYIALTALLLTACAGPKANFHIYGTVTNPELEGACIFLVPAMEKVIEPTKENLDSTFIKDGKFEFHGNVERMSDLRIQRQRRHNVQNLLIVTEPGTIYVTIGRESSGGGTPQNDSLQVWKDANREFAIALSSNKDKAFRDSLSRAFDERTWQLAHNCGDSSTLSKFLFHLHPQR